MIPVIKNPYFILFLFLFDISIVLVLLYNIPSVYQCDCFTKRDVTVKTRLDYIVMIELAFLAVYILNFIHLWRLTNTSVGQIKLLHHLKIVLGVLVAIMVVLYCFLYYFLTLLQDKVRLNCSCFQTELKYIVYFQLIVFSVSYLVLLHQLFMQWFTKFWRRTYARME